MRTQAEKGRAFQALHARDHAFIIPNPWDAGSAHLLAGLGFEALATTSAGFAFSIGLRDNAVGRDRMPFPLEFHSDAELQTDTDSRLQVVHDLLLVWCRSSDHRMKVARSRLVAGSALVVEGSGPAS